MSVERKHRWRWQKGLPHRVEACVHPGCTAQRREYGSGKFEFRASATDPTWTRGAPPCGSTKEATAA